MHCTCKTSSSPSSWVVITQSSRAMQPPSGPFLCIPWRWPCLKFHVEMQDQSVWVKACTARFVSAAFDIMPCYIVCHTLHALQCHPVCVQCCPLLYAYGVVNPFHAGSIIAHSLRCMQSGCAFDVKIHWAWVHRFHLSSHCRLSAWGISNILFKLDAVYHVYSTIHQGWPLST